jgi:hypothetical protein
MTDVETDDLLGESRQTVRHTIDDACLETVYLIAYGV